MEKGLTELKSCHSAEYSEKKKNPDILLIDFKIDIIRANHSQSLYLGTVIVFIGGYIKLYYSVFKIVHIILIVIFQRIVFECIHT